MKEFEIYIPLHYNDGSRIEDARILALKKRLIEEFGGLTVFPQQNEGTWQVGTFTFREKIIIARVLSVESRRVSLFFEKLKKKMQKDFGQSEVLIVSRTVEVV